MLLLDITDSTCSCTNTALNSLYKSIYDNPAESDGGVIVHENPFISSHIEDISHSFSRILEKIFSSIENFITISPGKKPENLAKAIGWTRFTQDEFAAIEKHLNKKHPDQFTIDDWMMLVDLIIHRYLPRDVINSQSEYMAVRSVIAGKVQQQMSGIDVGPKTIKTAIDSLPNTVTGAVSYGLSEVDEVVIRSAMARTAMDIVDIGEKARSRIKKIIVDHEIAKAYSDPKATQWNLQQKMLDELGVLNKDWRRIAATETTENANTGFIASLEPGDRVKRIEAYEGACSFCKHINGRIFTVVSPSKEDKNGQTEVWVGKTNIGRSPSPRKRIGDELVDRLESEMWWPAAGVQHPNCRGGWIKMIEKPDNVSQEFVDKLDQLLDKM